MSVRNITFPPSPVPLQIFHFGGRSWIYLDPPGVWKSYSGEGDGDGNRPNQDVLKWSQVYEKPEQIDLLGDENKINGGSYLGS